uniref:Oxygen-evolving enhancer protein 3 n=1 Tax=Araucaria cunninghamii TaxID=56994 RepID=A0A0D6R6Z0_ARACU
MAQTMASMAGLCGASQAAVAARGESGARLPATAFKPRAFAVRAHGGRQSAASDEPAAAATRRSLLGLLAAGAALGAAANNRALAADAKSIKVEGPPPPSGGLPGTLNSDEPRDLDLPLKERFFLQPLTPAQAAARVKESAKDIMNVKELIDKKAWPYVQNDLRLKASYLRYDLNTVISAKPKEEKKPLKVLTSKLFDVIDSLDYAARQKSKPMAEKYYAQTVSALNDVLAKLG